MGIQRLKLGMTGGRMDEQMDITPSHALTLSIPSKMHISK
jgi:hypothetical protein